MNKPSGIDTIMKDAPKIKVLDGIEIDCLNAVSYTHLTLPTILRV